MAEALRADDPGFTPHPHSRFIVGYSLYMVRDYLHDPRAGPPIERIIYLFIIIINP